MLPESRYAVSQDDPAVPIDGGITLLLAAGGAMRGKSFTARARSNIRACRRVGASPSNRR
jgi:hypothetical protein